MLLLQAGKRSTVGHVAEEEKKKKGQNLSSSLKPEGFVNASISAKVSSEICLFDKMSYWSNEAKDHLRRKVLYFDW